MPIEYEFHDKICYMVTRGKFSKADVDEYFLKMYNDPAFSRCIGILLHDQKSMYIPTTADIKSVAANVRKSIGGFEGKIAVVVDSAFKYGMGRMLEALSRDEGIRVFRSQEEARMWLNKDII
jgi:hypothetical protein